MLDNANKIAIIGLSGQFPGADSIEEYWDLLINAREGITSYSDEELEKSGIPKSEYQKKNYVPRGGNPSYMDCFDAEFFGYSPKEALLMDPQHRKTLEHLWHALEDAGCDPQQYEGVIGVYMGMGLNTYLLKNIIASGNWDEKTPEDAIYSNGYDYLSTRASYKLNLKGPSVTIQTACSSSLVAIHHACQALLTYQCDVVLSGGVSVTTPLKSGYEFEKGSIFSPDGHCRPFDEKAQGTIFANGVGVVALKRLDDALNDGDRIYAAISASAINNDGADKVGYTAPSVEGQTEVIALAQSIAEVDPSDIQYIEAHGTGTNIGDPIEVRALSNAFHLNTDKKQYCAISSVKSNIGHLDAAAGVAGLIKLSLSLYHKKMPPTINFENPSSKVNFEDTPFYVIDKLKTWPSNENKPRYAGVSSLGFGGTNAHVILEDIEVSSTSAKSDVTEFIIPLSAKNESTMRLVKQNIVTYLRTHPNCDLASVAYTLQRGRQAFSLRTAVVCRSVEEAVEKLIDSKDTKCEHSMESITLDDMSANDIAQAWVMGRFSNWSKLYESGKLPKPSKTSLPLYPFERNRYWIDINKNSEKQKYSINEKDINIDNWFYTPVWSRITPDSNRLKCYAGKHCLVVAKNGQVVKSLIERLNEIGCSTTVAYLGENFEQKEKNIFSLNVTNKEDYSKLMHCLHEQKNTPDYLLHLCLLQNTTSKSVEQDKIRLSAAQENGLFSIMYLMQAHTKYFKGSSFKMSILSSDLYNVTGNEKINANSNTVIGACKVIAKEYENTHCNSISVKSEDAEQLSNQPSQLDHILSDMDLQKHEDIAYRGNAKWIRKFINLKLPEDSMDDKNLFEKGMYIITGGLGNFGMMMAKFIASHEQVDLLLIGRSAFPENKNWQSWLDEHNEEDPISEKIRKLQEIEALGSRVLYRSVNVADEISLDEAVQGAVSHFGAGDIKGAIHTAGVVDSGILDLKIPEGFDTLFSAKILGSYALFSVLDKYNLNFLLLCSSMNAIIGGLGQVDNTAANAFVDAFAERCHALGKTYVFAMNWGAVNESKPREFVSLNEFRDLSREHVKNRMTDDEMQEVFRRIFANNCFGPRIAVSTINFEVVLDTWNKVGGIDSLTKHRERTAFSRDNLGAVSGIEYREAETPLQASLVVAWEEILGVTPVGIDDDFFALGGHSLSAIRVNSHVKEAFDLTMHVMNLYELPTIRQLSQHLQKLIKMKQANEALLKEQA